MMLLSNHITTNTSPSLSFSFVRASCESWSMEMGEKNHPCRPFRWWWPRKPPFNNSVLSLFFMSLAAALVAATLFLSGNDWHPPEPAATVRRSPSANYPKRENHDNRDHQQKVAATEACDVFDGRWVFDDATRPLYSGARGSYISDDFACDRWGRKDTRYQHWRWQPNACNLPRFNATVLLEKLRGKRMVFVGDSVSRNQWYSMVSLLETHYYSSPLPPPELNYTKSLSSFRAEEYNASIEFYWSPLLVESNCDDPVNHRGITERVIRAGAGAVDKHALVWGGADVLVFNSHLWWPQPGVKATWPGSTQEEAVGVEKGFELALKAWSEWLLLNNNNIGTHEKQVYFMSYSPSHVTGEGWGAAAGQSCYGEEEPFDASTGYIGTTETDEKLMRMAAESVGGLRRGGVRARLLNITHLTKFRKDGHTSVFRKFWDDRATERAANPSGHSDCIHWCLPGVPDVWNELLYYYILHS